ncbi:hypothetical protein ACLGI4_22700 [Streptomyces sp. HMX112]|uniref:hypothetical protein n=1 Tax=Streptomyces sp. HMX112 TaxID=3390850 RepID=UPI003A809DC2
MIPLAPLGLGDVLGGAFTTLGRHWRTLLGVALAVYGTAAVVIGAGLGAAYLMVGSRLDRMLHWTGGVSPAPGDFLPLVYAFAGVYLFAAVVLLIAGAMVQASCAAVLQEAVLGRPATFGAVWRRAWRRMGAVLGTVLLVALVAAVPALLLLGAFVGLVLSFVSMALDGSSGFGLFLLCLLGALVTGPVAAWLWVRYSLAPAVAVFEGAGARTAMSRSAQLVRGSWWRIFGIALLGYAIAALANYLVQLPLSLLNMLPSTLTDPDETSGSALAVTLLLTTLVVGLIAAVVGQILTAAFPVLVTGLLYVDQRIRKEDLAAALARAAAADSPAGP